MTKQLMLVLVLIILSAAIQAQPWIDPSNPCAFSPTTGGPGEFNGIDLCYDPQDGSY